MVANKKRLYIALYPSGGTKTSVERRYHWAFLVGPKAEDKAQPAGTKYHVRNPPNNIWIYEEAPLIDVRRADNLLARVLIAKVKDEESLIRNFRGVQLVQHDPNWRCRTWMATVTSNLSAAGTVVAPSQLDWNEIERIARQYVASKIEDGRYGQGKDMSLPKPMWDMLKGREVIP